MPPRVSLHNSIIRFFEKKPEHFGAREVQCRVARWFLLKPKKQYG
jgi:hypothetical protein